MWTPKLKILLAIAIGLLIWGCGTVKSPYISSYYRNWTATDEPSVNISRTVYLLGNTGFKDTSEALPVFSMLKAHLSTADSNTSVVFLGDNILPAGMPKKDAKSREKAEKQILWQLDQIKDFKAEILFLPGDKDWKNTGSGGAKAVKRQEDFIQEYLDRGDVFVPDNACGEVEVIKHDNSLVFLFIDSQWWLHDWTKDKKTNEGCDNTSRQAFLDELKEEFLDHRNKQIVVFMHHPLYSNGHSGGRFSAMEHLFPFTLWKPNLYLPLPVLGSIYAYSRSTAGAGQDIASRHYFELKTSILEVADRAEVKNVVFVAGHEHNLQYQYPHNFDYNSHHFVNSGSATGTSYAGSGGKADFVHQKKGFGKLVYYTNGSMWLEFWVVSDGDAKGKLVFRQKLTEPRPDLVYETIDTINYELPDSFSAIAQIRYHGNKAKKLWLGEQYRDSWSATVKLPVINLNTELGGLSPEKKGGGFASTSLRLSGPDGKEYSLRSIDKSVTKVLPPEFRDLVALEILQDQISAIHPYGALIIPPLADAAGIYHTNPKVVYLKHQPRLGIYNSLLKEGMYLFEERPDGNWKDEPSFGNSKEIIGSTDLMMLLRKNEKHQIDQHWMLKSRIFDLWIHDWDRHEDQWRWASYDKGDSIVYRPIPRDRDEAFYKFKGVLPVLVATFGVKNFKAFRKDLKAVAWQSYNARSFDRYFLNKMTKQDWVDAARKMQQDLTDSVIDSAFRAFPPEIYPIDQAEMSGILKARRGNLEKIALRLYAKLAHEVDVIGTERDDYFVVERKKNGDLTLKVFHIGKKGKEETPYYQREFVRKETKFLNLFGLEGEDVFKLEGKGRKGITVRIIGGEGNDKVKDESRVAGLLRKTKVYDLKEGIKLDTTTCETQNNTSNRYDVNEYDWQRKEYNNFLPLLGFGYNYDDGIFLGGGFMGTTYRFRKQPYSTKQRFNFIVSTRSGAFSLDYTGDFIGYFKKLDFFLTVDFKNPDYENYFGLGNSTLNEIDEDRRYYWLRLRRFTIAPQFKYSAKGGIHQFRFGPMYESMGAINVAGRIIDNPETGISANDIKLRHYLGASISSVLRTVDNIVKPTSGFSHLIKADYLNQVTEQDKGFFLLHAEFSNYLSFKIHGDIEATLANRIGASAIFGEYQFFHNPAMGINTYLRGFRNERFRGQVLFFHNIDLRLSLYYWKNKVLPMELGLNGGFDYGRVWQDKATDRQYFHKGYTLGIWISPLKFFVINPFVTFSKEEKGLFSLRTGFYF